MKVGSSLKQLPAVQSTDVVCSFILQVHSMYRPCTICPAEDNIITIQVASCLLPSCLSHHYMRLNHNYMVPVGYLLFDVTLLMLLYYLRFKKINCQDSTWSMLAHYKDWWFLSNMLFTSLTTREATFRQVSFCPRFRHSIYIKGFPDNS